MKLVLDTVNLAYWLNEKDAEKNMQLGTWKTIYYLSALIILSLQIFIAFELMKASL